MAGVFDPFGDYASRGYLRNVVGEKDPKIVGHLETASFEDAVHEALRKLRKVPVIDYSSILQCHRTLFESVYPWAGEDRSVNAPDIAISRAGYSTLFAGPAHVQRASEFALARSEDHADLYAHPGEIFGYFAHAHPFLEGNGRTLLTVFSELCSRADFQIRWERIEKTAFLQALTQELLKPGSAMDKLVIPHQFTGASSALQQAVQLRFNFRDPD